MTFDAKDHQFAGTEFDEYAPAQYATIGLCSCHNPDGNGEGRTDFRGHNLVEVVNAWSDHVLELLLEDSTIEYRRRSKDGYNFALSATFDEPPLIDEEQCYVESRTLLAWERVNA